MSAKKTENSPNQREKKNRLPIFEERLREVVKETGGNSALADVTGMNRQTFALYTNGKRIPDCSVLRRISQMTGVSTDWLLGLSNMKHVDPSMAAVCVHTRLKPESIDAYDRWKDRNQIMGPRAVDHTMQSPLFGDLMKAIANVYEYGYYGDADKYLTDPHGQEIQNQTALSLQFMATQIFSRIMTELNQDALDDSEEESRKDYQTEEEEN